MTSKWQHPERTHFTLGYSHLDGTTILGPNPWYLSTKVGQMQSQNLTGQILNSSKASMSRTPVSIHFDEILGS